jgi:hypothetical protein
MQAQKPGAELLRRREVLIPKKLKTLALKSKEISQI